MILEREQTMQVLNSVLGIVMLNVLMISNGLVDKLMSKDGTQVQIEGLLVHVVLN